MFSDSLLHTDKSCAALKAKGGLDIRLCTEVAAVAQKLHLPKAVQSSPPSLHTWQDYVCYNHITIQKVIS